MPDAAAIHAISADITDVLGRLRSGDILYIERPNGDRLYTKQTRDGDAYDTLLLHGGAYCDRRRRSEQNIRAQLQATGVRVSFDADWPDTYDYYGGDA